MTLLEWSEALALGIDPIDEQHKVLLDIMNELNEHLLRGKNSQGRRTALRRLNEYTREHFTMEEGLMLQAGFPGLEGHRKVHSKFAEKLETFAETDLAAEPQKALDMLTFLQEWLVDHILGQDLLFAHHYKTHPQP